MRVLIADDEKSFASALAALVASCGHEVVGVVHSGLDAIRSYQRNHPDVVLMDYNMAKLNGLTACRNILSSDPAGRVVFLSGIDYKADLAPAHSGAVASLQKPIKLEDLRRVFETLQTAALDPDIPAPTVKAG
ncbi:MAG TPA: response regulator transcription factor [Chthoniobacterales bacterium]|nr:response regulator transcription factor [Chthoniobacterales bacterium]